VESEHPQTTAGASCEYCCAVVPLLEVNEQAFNAVTNALSNGSPTLAAAELQQSAGCAAAAARAWVDHLLTCAYAWPNAEPDQRILRNLDEAFAGIGRPEHFTDYAHCPECKEHDDTLRARTRETLQRADLGSGGWDPINFCSEVGIGYLFPALARYALLPSVWLDRDWYGCQLLWHLSYRAGSNRFLVWCSPRQREAIYELLRHLQQTRMQEIANYYDEELLSTALAAWEPPAR
jgi:hypothetical protein